MTTHMAPMAEEVYVRQPYEQTSTYGMPIEPVAAAPIAAPMQHHNTVVLHQDQAYDRASMEAAELAAFEKGRMQGEMEAIRRAEAAAPLKTMEPVGLAHNAPVLLDQPDVLEIHRLTWLQRLAGVLGELCLLGTIALTVAWGQRWREGFDWVNSDNNGEHRMLNGGILAFSIGLFLNANAITNYRFMPLRTPSTLNRVWYLFLQLAAGAAYAVAFAVMVMTFPTGETTFWRVDTWVFTFALATWAAHAAYSAFRTVLEHVWPVDYETWAEVNNHLDQSHTRARLGHKKSMSLDGKSATTHDGAIDRRTVYTPAPRGGVLGWFQRLRAGRRNKSQMAARHSTANTAAHTNTTAGALNAAGTGPRWTETPRTHAENFFLLARSKWANVAYWSMGAAFLMIISAIEANQASGRGSWSSGNSANEPVDRLGFDSTEAHVVGALGLLTLGGLMFMSYAAMPPRTTLIKHAGGLAADARRPSISHNAETIV